MSLSSSLRVALLDDAALVRDCLAQALTSQGATICGPYDSGWTFIRQLDSDKPNVALIGIEGDDPERVSLLREVNQFHPDVQLLVISRHPGPGTVEECFRSGASGCVNATTTTLDSLVRSLQAIAQGNRVFPPTFFEALLQPPTASALKPTVLSTLSTREREVLTYLAGGADNLKIASLLTISERTVKAHVSSLYKKLGQENRTQLALHARQLGVRPPADL